MTQVISDFWIDAYFLRQLRANAAIAASRVAAFSKTKKVGLTSSIRLAQAILHCEIRGTIIPCVEGRIRRLGGKLAKRQAPQPDEKPGPCYGHKQKKKYDPPYNGAFNRA